MKILSIPIYRHSPEEFNSRVLHKENEVREYYKTTHSKFDEQEFDKYFCKFYRSKMHYSNFQIGVLYVIYNYNRGDIDYQTEMAFEERKVAHSKDSYNKYPIRVSLYSAPSKTKEVWDVPGFHDNVGKTNLETAKTIKESIGQIIHLETYKNLYFDLEIFNLLIDNIDFQNIFSQIKME